MCNIIALKLCSALLLCCIQSSWTQLAFHSDANTNSFTLKTPNLQQSFTRIYGIKPSGEGSEKLQQQQQQQQTQPQQVDQEPQQQYTPLSNNLQYQPTQPMGQAVRYNRAYAQPVVQQQQQQHPNQFVAASAAYQTQQHAATPPQYAQQMQSMRAVNQQQALVPQQQPLPQAQPLEQPASSLAPYVEQLNAAYYAYQQQQQLYNQQQQLLRNLYTNHPDKSNIVSTAKAQSPVTSNNQFYTHDQYVNYLNNQHSQILDDQQRQVQQQYRTANYSKPTALAYSTPSANAVPSAMVPSRNGLLGVQYSPSNKVSHVNYASGNLAYNY